MPGHILTLNDYDTYRLGLIVERYEGVSGSAAVRLRAQGILERAGLVLLSATPDAQARTVVVTGILEAATVAQARANLEQLRGRLAQGRLELRFSDLPGRVFLAHRLQVTDEPLPHQTIQRRTRLRLELQCLDSYVYATEPTAVRCTGTLVPCPLGEAPSAPVIQLMGGATSPAVTYRHANGTVLGGMTFTDLVLGTNDYLVIDADAQVISLVTNGVSSDAAPALTAGDFFALDPAHGNPTFGDWPTLECTGSTEGVALYRKAWR